jgi:hypothetical protein
MTGGFLYAFSMSKSSLRVFEEGYWKDFQKYSGITKEQAKTLNMIFPSKNKTKNSNKTSAYVQKVPVYYLKPSEKYHLGHSLFDVWENFFPPGYGSGSSRPKSMRILIHNTAQELSVYAR